MELEIVRRVRGNLHGSIDITHYEDLVIAHPAFQRLRRVKQTAFLHLAFPGATHTRFEHSLGVMHMADLAWRKITKNQERLKQSADKIIDFKAKELLQDGAATSSASICHGLLYPSFEISDKYFNTPYCYQVFRIAALMHDIGHPPFSHSGERFLAPLDKIAKENPQAPQYLKDWFKKTLAKSTSKGDSSLSVRHEVYSLLLIAKVIEDIERDSNTKISIDPQDVISVLIPEIAPKKTSPLYPYGIYRTLHELISAELDIDRMDYLLRDSRECGVVYGIFDAVRILDALCLYVSPEDESLHVAISHSGLAAFEDYLRARQSMYAQLYFHKTAASAEAMMQYIRKRLGGWTLPAGIDEYTEVDENSIHGELLKACESSAGSEKEKAETKRLIRDLLLDRRLWRRCYEISGDVDGRMESDRLAAFKDKLISEGTPFEQVSSRNTLTRFRPRENKQPSPNYLRLIRRDHDSFPRVVPIEDYSRIVQDNTMINIHRIYVPRTVAKA